MSIAPVPEDIEGVLPDHLAPGEDAVIVGHNGRHVENESERKPAFRKIDTTEFIRDNNQRHEQRHVLFILC